MKPENDESMTMEQIISKSNTFQTMEPTVDDLVEEISEQNIDEDINECVNNVLENDSNTYVDTDYGTYINNIKDIPLLTPERELELAFKVQNNDEDAKNELTTHNLKLVVSIASHYYNEYMTQMDLIQEGNIGLMTAVEKFNPNLGYRFSTYATWWIKQAMTRALANQGRIIRLPVHMIEKMNKITYAQRQITTLYHTDTPSEKQIAEYLHWSVNEVRKVLNSTADTLSYDTPVGEDEHGVSTTIGDFIQDPDSDTSIEGEKYIITDTVADVMNTLTERERNVLKLRLGFVDGRIYTLQEIGDMYHVSRERIRQIETKAFRKLRAPKNKMRLKALL